MVVPSHVLIEYFEHLPDLEAGWVWLAGSGPGDIGLFSLQALKGLHQADVVVHDALVNDEILRMVPKTTLLHYAGKRGGKPSTLQKDISETIVRYAKEGKRVLRLKGGDPMMFGRGAEEAEALVAANIPFRVIPGVTSGMAASTYAGIPLTHRELSSSVSFITGHAAHGDVPDFSWSALAQGSDTLVFYMAIKYIAKIQAALLHAGLPPERPVAIISNGTMADQKMVKGQLVDLAELAKQIAPPSIVVVGEVVQLSDRLDWFGAPLMMGGEKTICAG